MLKLVGIILVLDGIMSVFNKRQVHNFFYDSIRFLRVTLGLVLIIW